MSLNGMLILLAVVAILLLLLLFWWSNRRPRYDFPDIDNQRVEAGLEEAPPLERESVDSTTRTFGPMNASAKAELAAKADVMSAAAGVNATAKTEQKAESPFKNTMRKGGR